MYAVRTSKIRLDYGTALCDCSKEKKTDQVQRVKNDAAGLIARNFDYINWHAIDSVNSLYYLR